MILIDGVPCNGEGGWRYGEPLHEMRWRPWYVCPRTGLLRRVKVRARRRQRRTPPSPPRYIPVGKTLQCRLLDGAWHLVTLKPFPALAAHHARCHDVDILFNKPVAAITTAEARQQYGAEVYAVAKRRLAKRELRQYPIPIDAWG